VHKKKNVEKCAKSALWQSIQALEVATEVGYPVICRAACALDSRSTKYQLKEVWKDGKKLNMKF